MGDEKSKLIDPQNFLYNWLFDNERGGKFLFYFLMKDFLYILGFQKNTITPYNFYLGTDISNNSHFLSSNRWDCLVNYKKKPLKNNS